MEVSRKKKKKQNRPLTFFYSQNGAKHTHFKKPWFGSDFSLSMAVSVRIASAFLGLGSQRRFPPDPYKGVGWGWAVL